MFSFKGIGMKIFATAMAVVAVAVGIYLTFFHSSGFVKARATIVSIEQVADGLETDHLKEASFRATVAYTVGGADYTAVLDQEDPSYEVGKTVSVLYDPNDPSVVHGDSFMGLYAIGVGIAILAVIIVSEIRKKKSLKKVKAVQEKDGGTGYQPSLPGTERQLYFLTDLGTQRAGHRIEDADRQVLYEAKMTKYTLTAPYGFDFIDHEHGRTVPHLVGHEESTDWGNSLLFDNHHTFTLDGEDIWKHLRRNGIAVESELTGAGRVQYRILRDGQEIAVAVGSSQNVHEEDEATQSRLASLAPIQGFFRLSTTETDLGLLFVTLLAFARSGASDDHGGSRRTLWNTMKNV